MDIAHPYIDDLTVELVAPDGTARTLHDRSGGNADGIDRTYAPDFGGAGIAGDWTLRVSDGAPGDAGTLNGWTLTIGHDGAGGSVTGLAGSGSRYLVTVSAAQEGTYSLDVMYGTAASRTRRATRCPARTPTGADHTYTVIADTTAPTVASIERSDPIEESTSETTLVFGVTFGEDVTGVDAGDFALSPDSGSGPGQFTHARTPGLAIPDNAAAVSDAITVPGPGPPRRSPSPWTSRTRTSTTSRWSSSPPTAPPGRCTTAAAATRTASSGRTRPTLAAPGSRGTGPCAQATGHRGMPAP